MANAPVHDLIQAIQQLPLLKPSQADELTKLRRQFPEPRALCRELIAREWLTPYQANQLLIGRSGELRIGSYLILEKLGDSPIGAIYKARHQHLQRMATLQVLRPELLARPGTVERFYAEVQSVSQLTHRHLVGAYDAGPVGASHFFAMENVDGVDLQTLVAQSGPLSIAEACSFIEQAALGLQYACERRLLHHDVRPANLLLVREGPRSQAIARSSSPGIIKVRNLGLTILHQEMRPVRDAKGTLADAGESSLFDFHAPEAALDVRSEVYNLGCTFYYLLAGRVPFPGGTAEQKQRRQQQEEPTPLAGLRADVPAPVAELIGRLMAKDPARRCASPGEVASRIAALAPPDGWQLPAASRTTMAERLAAMRRAFSYRPRRRVLAGGILLLASLCVIGWMFLRSPSAAPDTTGSRPSDTKGPVVTVPAKPLPPALVVQCGRGNGKNQNEVAWPGYSVALLQGYPFDGWGDPAPKRYCWYHETQLRFDVLVPRGAKGVLRLYCLDGDNAGRRQKLSVNGKFIEEMGLFGPPGKTFELPMTAADTHTGKIEVLIERTGPVNAVISTVEFAPSFPFPF